MKACVIFETQYGNTEKIARSLEAGLQMAGVETVCVNLKDVVTESLRQYDLICVGGPTHNRTASEAMRDLLERLKGGGLSGKQALAFDTRRDSLLAGSAASYIEAKLREFGLRTVAPRESGIIVGPEVEKKRGEFGSREEWKDWRHKSEGLREGEERRFQEIGTRIGAALAAKKRGAVAT